MLFDLACTPWLVQSKRGATARNPFVPAANSIAAMPIAEPRQIVCTGGLITGIVSQIAKASVFEADGFATVTRSAGRVDVDFDRLIWVFARKFNVRSDNRLCYRRYQRHTQINDPLLQQQGCKSGGGVREFSP